MNGIKLQKYSHIYQYLEDEDVKKQMNSKMVPLSKSSSSKKELNTDKSVITLNNQLKISES